MNIIEKIKAEIERLKGRLVRGACSAQVSFETSCKDEAYNELLSFLSTLEKEERPEPYNPVYDEAYLNEKIKKATESWKGVDVDAMLAECRGLDEEKSEKPINPEELEKEAVSYCFDNGLNISPRGAADFARHFYDLGCRRTAEKYDELEYNRQREEESDKPMNPEGLEEEMDKFFETMPVLEHENIFEDTFKNIAHHFAQWGAEHSGDSEIPNDLAAAAIDIADSLLAKPKDYVLSAKADYWNGAHDGVFAGAKWQADHAPLPEDTVIYQKGVEEGKRLMMEEAVEADVNIYRDIVAGKSWAEFVVEMPINNLGEKVRVIVIPNTDEK